MFKSGLSTGVDRVPGYKEIVANLDDTSRSPPQKAHLSSLMQSSEWNFCEDKSNPIAPILQSTSIQFQFLHDRINNHLTNIKNYIKFSEVNIWVMCLLNKHGFLIDNPLYNPITRKNRTREEVSHRMGCAILSRLIQSGIVRYNLFDADIDVPDNTKRQTFIQHLSMKETKGLIPPKDDIQKLLENSIQTLSDSEFALFQKYMRDMWGLQPFRQPLDIHERKKGSTKPTMGDDPARIGPSSNQDNSLDLILQHFSQGTPINPRASKRYVHYYNINIACILIAPSMYFT